MGRRSHQIEYGYRAELGEHEIWADSPRYLAQVMRDFGFTWAHTKWERSKCGGKLHLISEHERSELLACCSGDADARLPQHLHVRMVFGQFGDGVDRSGRTPDTIVMYKLVVRESFRSEHG